MWRTKRDRAQSAAARLEMAREIWGWQSHPAQRRLFCAPESVRVAACGRRWGKTECLSLDIATLALAEPGARQLVVAPTETQARLLGEAVWERLRQAEEKGRGRVAAQARPSLRLTLPGPNGAAASEVVCRTAGRDGRNLRGLWAHRIIVDEAAYVPDRVLREVLPPMLADKGGEFLLASTPCGRRSAFYGLHARASGPQPPESCRDEVSYAAFQCPTADNAHLDRAWLRGQREEMGELLYAQEFEAVFVDDFGMVFREDDIAGAVTDLPGVTADREGVRSAPASGGVYAVGIDWGRKLDYTVVAVLDAARHPLRLVHLSRWQATGWDTQAAAAAAIITQFQPRRVLADGSSIGDPIAEMLDRHIARQAGSGPRPTVERFTFGAESKQALIDRLNVGLSAQALQLPPHPVLLGELRNFEYAPGGPGRLKTAARGSGHDDCVIALALAFYAAPDPAASLHGFGLRLGSELGAGREDE